MREADGGGVLGEQTSQKCGLCIMSLKLEAACTGVSVTYISTYAPADFSETPSKEKGEDDQFSLHFFHLVNDHEQQ